MVPVRVSCGFCDKYVLLNKQVNGMCFDKQVKKVSIRTYKNYTSDSSNCNCKTRAFYFQ